MSPDIEDDDLGIYCSFEEFAKDWIVRLERQMAKSHQGKGELDTHDFKAYRESMRLIDLHFAGRATVKHERCGLEHGCDTHNGHLLWQRCDS